MTQPSFQSLAQAVEAYYDELRRYIHHRTGSESLAEDVVQETWIRARRVAAVMPGNPRAYLYRMASNLAVDKLRQQQIRSAVEWPATGDAAGYGDGLSQIPSSDPGPEEATADRQEFAILTDAIRELPDKCRQVFLAYRGEGLTMREVAERLGISEKTVEKHIARAMVHCRQKLRKAGRAV